MPEKRRRHPRTANPYLTSFGGGLGGGLAGTAARMATRRLNPWLSTALSTSAGITGFRLGAHLGRKYGPKKSRRKKASQIGTAATQFGGAFLGAAPGILLGKAEATDGTHSRFPLTERSAKALHQWAVDLGVPNIVPPEEMHVTVMYSSTPVPAYEPHSGGHVVNPGGGLTRIGPDNGYLALEITDDFLKGRHEMARRMGAKHDFPTYRPHITISKDPGDWSGVSYPPPFAIRLGPEVVEPLKKAVLFNDLIKAEPRRRRKKSHYGESWGKAGGILAGAGIGELAARSGERWANRRWPKNTEVPGLVLSRLGPWISRKYGNKLSGKVGRYFGETLLKPQVVAPLGRRMLAGGVAGAAGGMLASLAGEKIGQYLGSKVGRKGKKPKPRKPGKWETIGSMAGGAAGGALASTLGWGLGPVGFTAGAALGGGGGELLGGRIGRWFDRRRRRRVRKMVKMQVVLPLQKARRWYFRMIPRQVFPDVVGEVASKVGRGSIKGLSASSGVKAATEVGRKILASKPVKAIASTSMGRRLAQTDIKGLGRRAVGTAIQYANLDPGPLAGADDTLGLAFDTLTDAYKHGGVAGVADTIGASMNRSWRDNVRRQVARGYRFLRRLKRSGRKIVKAGSYIDLMKADSPEGAFRAMEAFLAQDDSLDRYAVSLDSFKAGDTRPQTIADVLAAIALFISSEVDGDDPVKNLNFVVDHLREILTAA